MTRRFIVRPLAEADLEDAARWYSDKRAGLAERFLTDVDQTFARIRERPFQFPTVTGEVRRALLRHVPVRCLLPGVRRDRRRGRGVAPQKEPEGVATTSALRLQRMAAPNAAAASASAAAPAITR